MLLNIKLFWAVILYCCVLPIVSNYHDAFKLPHYLCNNRVSYPRRNKYYYVCKGQHYISNLCNAVGCPVAAIWLTWEFAPRPVWRIPPDVQIEYVAVFAWLSIDGNADVYAEKLLMFIPRYCYVLKIKGTVNIKDIFQQIQPLIKCILCLISPHPVQSIILRCKKVMLSLCIS